MRRFLVGVGLALSIGMSAANAQTYHPHGGHYVYQPQVHYYVVPQQGHYYTGHSGGVVYAQPVPQTYSHRHVAPEYRPVPRQQYHYYSHQHSPQPAYAPPVAQTCSRVANPISRRACECAVQFGGVAGLNSQGEVLWHDPRGGGANLALQACKYQGVAEGVGPIAREIDPPGLVR
jgi:hypothetical protein